jgi:hypothetical protein
MPLLAVGILIGVLLCALYKAHASPSGLRIFDDGETYIVIEDRSVRVRRGWVAERAMAALADTLRDAGVSSGHITMSRDNRIAISWHVPPALHQTIRNILLFDRGVATPAGGCGAANTH